MHERQYTKPGEENDKSFKKFDGGNGAKSAKLPRVRIRSVSKPAQAVPQVPF